MQTGEVAGSRGLLACAGSWASLLTSLPAILKNLYEALSPTLPLPSWQLEPGCIYRDFPSLS